MAPLATSGWGLPSPCRLELYSWSWPPVMGSLRQVGLALAPSALMRRFCRSSGFFCVWNEVPAASDALSPLSVPGSILVV